MPDDDGRKHPLHKEQIINARKRRLARGLPVAAQHRDTEIDQRYDEAPALRGYLKTDKFLEDLGKDPLEPEDLEDFALQFDDLAKKIRDELVVGPDTGGGLRTPWEISKGIEGGGYYTISWEIRPVNKQPDETGCGCSCGCSCGG